MQIAIVILNWNGRTLLEQFLPSVIKHTEGANIYLADNASNDDSCSFVSKHYPSVKIIQNQTNGGYAKGYNDALKGLNEDLFVLLNSDVAVTEGWLTPIIAAFKANKKLVAAQPKILDFNNPSQFEYAGAAGGFIDELCYPYCRGRIFDSIEKDQGQYNDTTSIFWATGACLFIRNEAFWDVGGFDEDFFAHMEEIDLCWRLQAQGGEIQYIGASEILHVGGATLDQLNPKKTFYNFRNSLLCLVKNRGGYEVWWIILKRMMLDGVAAFRFLMQGKPKHFLAILKSHGSFYGSLPKFLKKRKKNASRIDYYSIKSIVWNYFIAKKRNFNNL